MKHSDDIVNLFQQFGAKADPYHELARQQEHKLSRERWPLVSAVRDAVADDVPSVDRRAGAPGAPAPQAAFAPAPASARPVPAGWAQPAARPAAEVPPPVVAPTSMPAPMTPADRVPPSAVLAARSPLAGLAGLRTAAAPSPSDAAAGQPGSLPADLPSVFARLAGAGDTPARPAAAWQPRKAHP